jgi:hypothetical protein
MGSTLNLCIKMWITINGFRPLALTKREAARALGNKISLINRMIWCARHQPHDPWVKIVSNRAGTPGTEVTLDTESVEQAYQRLLAGDEPPRLPKQRSQA